MPYDITEFTEQLEETLEETNRTIKSIFREADDEPLDSQALEDLDRCWCVLSHACKVYCMKHGYQHEHAARAGLSQPKSVI